MYKKITTTIVLSTIMMIVINNTYALTAEQRSSVGYQAGLQDCGTGTSTMLNSASNAGHHSQDYMQGYYEGLNSCVKNVSGQNGDNQNSNNRNDAQSQGTSQHFGMCVTVFTGCSQTSGESQGVSN